MPWHSSSLSAKAHQHDGEAIFSSLDDTIVVAPPERIRKLYDAFRAALWRHARLLPSELSLLPSLSSLRLRSSVLLAIRLPCMRSSPTQAGCRRLPTAACRRVSLEHPRFVPGSLFALGPGLLSCCRKKNFLQSCSCLLIFSRMLPSFPVHLEVLPPTPTTALTWPNPPTAAPSTERDGTLNIMAQ